MKLLSTNVKRGNKLPLIKEENLIYIKMVALNPDIKELVNRLGLVIITKQEIDNPKLITLAKNLIEINKSYSKEELLQRIKEKTKVNQERAEKGLKLFIQAGAIEKKQKDKFYLIGSTSL